MSSKLFGACLVIALCGPATAQDEKPKTARVFMSEFETKDKAVANIEVIQVLDPKKMKVDTHKYHVTDKTKFVMVIGTQETVLDAKTVLTDKMAPNYFKKNVWVTVTVEGKELTAVKFTNKKADLTPGPGIPIKP
jgi:hypothetical protein